MRKPSVFVIFLTVFIDLIGFGIVVPLVPIYSEHYEAGGFLIGVIIASFSAMQFIFAPIWGKWSDRYGRRPILLISTAGAALSYVVFALGSGLENHTTALWVLFISRAMAGLCGGNITVAQAYIADITPPQDRSRRMGLIGMAFGLGFIFGPALGAISLAGISVGGLSFSGLGPTGPGWVAAALCAGNFLLAFFILAESRKPSSEQASQRPHLKQWLHTLAQPKVGVLILIFFLATFAFSCFESTLPLMVNDNFNLGIAEDHTRAARTVMWLFIYCGVISAFVQGGAIGRLVKSFGEVKLIFASLMITGLSLALLPFVKGDGQLYWGLLFESEGLPWLKMLIVLALLSVGTALTRPPLFGLLSNLTPAHEQGATIGVAQGAGSLARILGPIFAATLHAHTPALPYVICAVISVIGGLLAIQRLHGARSAPATEAAPVG